MMETKHVFVVLIDLPEVLPFKVPEEKDVSRSFQYQERSILELSHFIQLLSKNYGESIYYIGQDIIADRFLNRFLFEKEGFMEIMMAEPVAVAAHFVNKRKAEKFVAALKKTLRKLLPKTSPCEVLINSIEVSEEQEQALSFETWQKLKEIRKND
jgi:hypothetical protein